MFTFISLAITTTSFTVNYYYLTKQYIFIKYK